MRTKTFSALRACAALALTAVSSVSFGAATIIIQNANVAGVGFNDPTPAAPVGGNMGTTLGQQRLNAFQYAASIWGATLDSTAVITIQSSFEALSCNATSAVLGSAGPISVWRDFAGAGQPATWYHASLANKVFGADLDGASPEIRARFNSNLGQATCLAGSPFYLGLDSNHGTAIDLVTVLLHEFGHGLGFSTTTNGTSGAYFLTFPSIYDHFLLDLTQNKTWIAMTPAERATSAINARRLVWTGANVTSSSSILAPGTPEMGVLTPASVAGKYLVGAAAFGAQLSSPGLTGEVMPVVDQANSIGLACTPLNAMNTLAVKNKIALVDRGTCIFTDKAKNVQNAGAIGMIVVDNVAGSPPPALAGADPTVTIPAVRITLADGTALKAALRTRSRTNSGMFVTLTIDPNVRAGADATGRVLVFTPNPLQSGSSVSHWDTSAFPNQLMEPSINGDLTHSVILPQDLTFQMLKDIGW